MGIVWLSDILMEVNEMKWKEYGGVIVCLGIGGLFIYGKYFVAVTDISKLGYEIAAYCWLILAMLNLIFKNTLDIKKKLLMEE